MSNISKSVHELPYDKTSAVSIFEYSKGLLGKKLRDFLHEEYIPKKGKGGIGQMVENLYFLLETNTNPEADFSSAGMELKCTPLKLSKGEDYLIKERLVCNIINCVYNSFEPNFDIIRKQHIRRNKTCFIFVQCYLFA